MDTWSVPKLWQGGSCWIIGGGKSVPYQFDVPEEVIEKVCSGKFSPSVYTPYMSVLHDKHVVGVNNAYQIGTWIDFLFFGDGSWHLVHQKQIARWPGVIVTCSPKFAGIRDRDRHGIKYMAKDKSHKMGISSNSSKVSWNFNSGAAAISLAVHLGAKKIFLLGFDMNASGKYTHWHGSHGKKGVKGPPFQKHLSGFPDIARDAKRMKVQIFNVNKKSTIAVFPKIKLDEALKLADKENS